MKYTIILEKRIHHLGFPIVCCGFFKFLAQLESDLCIFESTFSSDGCLITLHGDNDFGFGQTAKFPGGQSNTYKLDTEKIAILHMARNPMTYVTKPVVLLYGPIPLIYTNIYSTQSNIWFIFLYIHILHIHTDISETTMIQKHKIISIWKCGLNFFFLSKIL